MARLAWTRAVPRRPGRDGGITRAGRERCKLLGVPPHTPGVVARRGGTHPMGTSPRTSRRLAVVATGALVLALAAAFHRRPSARRSRRRIRASAGPLGSARRCGRPTASGTSRAPSRSPTSGSAAQPGGAYGNDCRAIPGATGQTYVVRSADVGSRLRAVVIATSAEEYYAGTTRAPSGRSSIVNPRPTTGGNDTINGGGRNDILRGGAGHDTVNGARRQRQHGRRQGQRHAQRRPRQRPHPGRATATTRSTARAATTC